jgi:hypothetical protein
MKLTKAKLKEIIKEELMKEDINTTGIVKTLYKNLKKFSKEQDRMIRKLAKGQNISQELHDELSGTKITRDCYEAFLGELK